MQFVTFKIHKSRPEFKEFLRSLLVTFHFLHLLSPSGTVWTASSWPSLRSKPNLIGWIIFINVGNILCCT